MRQTTILFLIATITALSGCSRRFGEAHPSVSGPLGMAQPAQERPRQQGQVFGRGGQLAGEPAQDVTKAESKESLASAQAQMQAVERKIIRNADLTIELDAPEEAQRRITSIAENHGGFVVNSESRQNDGNLQSAPKTLVTVIARVPAAKFAEAVEEIQKTGDRVIYRKDTGQDVTEEFIDLEARTRAKRALESQFLEIMKRAQKVSEALEVQTQLSEVRAEIEKMEGRRRFLENQASLSTITVRLQTPTPIVAATTGGFWHSIKLAFGDGLDTAAEIVLGIIWFVIVMIPVVLLILLPVWLIVRWLRRRVVWPKRPAPISAADQTP